MSRLTISLSARVLVILLLVGAVSVPILGAFLNSENGLANASPSPTTSLVSPTPSGITPSPPPAATTGVLTMPIVIPPDLPAATIATSGRTLGSPTAPATIALWEDLQCPYCAVFTKDLEPQIVSQLVATGQARLEYHDFVFLGQESLDAAVATRCVAAQNKFWIFQAYIFANQHGENTGFFSAANLAALAAAAGVDLPAYTTCIADPQMSAEVATETQRGQSLGIKATPTLIVNNTTVFEGAPTLAQLTAALSKVAPSPAASASGAGSTSSPHP